MKKFLEVFRASAGSGKTFTLAVKYITLLVENPDAYRHIVAVTFTNKATGEMKERILSQLYGIAYDLPSSSDYMDKMLEAFPGNSREDISHRATIALNHILHDYGHFRIQTIDSFFQSVLRSLARELELNGDVEFTLDGDELLDEAVDLFLRRLNEKSEGIKQVIEFVENNLNNNKKWDVTYTIKNFARNLLKEEYQERGKELREAIDKNGGEALKRFNTEVSKIKEECVKIIDKELKEIGNSFFVIANGCNMNDFLGKSKGLWSYFEKLRDFTTITEQAFPEISKNANKALNNDITKLAPGKPQLCNEIAVLLNRVKELFQNEMFKLNSCNMSLEMYHQLGLLNSIAKTIKEENERENRFLLAETTYCLSQMILDNTTFIFEKTGTEITHIFIDEFQDTSKLQWNCFKFMLDETIANGQYNLIVGDVKQSIYRWRNSDWNIMNNIGSYQPNATSIASQEVTDEEGKVYSSTNFRSCRRIVNFNNHLYRAATKCIEDNFKESMGKDISKLITAYKDVEQAVPKKREDEGYTEVRIIKKKNKEDKISDICLQQLMDSLDELMNKYNIPPKEIAILVRFNTSITDIVEEFKKRFPGMKIVSNEAYKLSTSIAVQLIIAAMRHIAIPEDDINLLNLVTLYNKFINKRECATGELIEKENHIKFLPEEYIDEIPSMKGLPIYELIERIVSTLRITEIKGEEAYIFSFLDHASQCINNKASDIGGFLKLWEESLCNETITATGKDCVTVMTIHSSKGLEFGTVIIPFCNWEVTGHANNTLWCETPDIEPYNILNLLPVNSKKAMLNSIYEKDYTKDYLYQIVDNLNILYVATTRAKNNLLIFTDSVNKKEEPKSMPMLFNHIIDELAKIEGSTYDKNLGIFVYGDKPKAVVKKEKEKNDNPFIIEDEDCTVQDFVYFDNRLTFKQSRELARFLATDEREKRGYDAVARGELMHAVLAKIGKAEELDKQLNKMLIEGLISTPQEMANIQAILRKALADPLAQEWFGGKYRLFNECSILKKEFKPDKNSFRPDRVMINDGEVIVVDYKFARPKEEHKEQVRDYMSLLKMIGYSSIKGYVWYVDKNKIEKV